MRPTSCFASTALLVVLGGSAGNAAAADGCAAYKRPIQQDRAALTGAELAAVASGGTLPFSGRAAAVALQPQGEVHYTVKPTRAPKANPAYGAELPLTNDAPGTLQVTLGADAWVDLVQNGRALRASAFSARPDCPGVRKSIRFSVAAGPVAIAIRDSADPSLKLMVSRVEPSP